MISKLSGFSRWLPIFQMISKLSGFSRWLPIFRIISKLSRFFQMTANFPDDFKTVRIFQMIANFPDYLKTVRIFPDDCQFSGWFQNHPDFQDDCQFSVLTKKPFKLSQYFQIQNDPSFSRWFPVESCYPESFGFLCLCGRLQSRLLSSWYQSPIILWGSMSRFAIGGPPGAKSNDMSHFGPFLRVSIEGWPQFTRPPWKI